MKKTQRKAPVFPVFYDIEGNPISVQQFTNLSLQNKKHIQQDALYFGLIYISTVWIGMDLGFPLSRKHPLIFETMVFFCNFKHDLYQMRYATKQEAVANHNQLVSRWKNPWYALKTLSSYLYHTV